MKWTTLKNGLRVVNFSSPHDFTFDDGTVLKAVNERESERMKIIFKEKKTENPRGWTDIQLSFELTSQVEANVGGWLNAYENDLLDVVVCPLPMITALTEKYGNEWMEKSPFRSIRMEDRIKKLVSSTKFCLQRKNRQVGPIVY